MAQDPAAPMPADAATPPAGVADSAPVDDANAPTVLLTVMDNGDGSYQLIEGDEADAPDGGAPIEPGPGEDVPDKGTTYDSLGALLKGVMDCVKKAQDGGEGGEQAFTAGFDGGSNASPPKAPPAAPPKY